MRKRKKKWVIGLAAVVTAAILILSYCQGRFLPAWIAWQEKSQDLAPSPRLGGGDYRLVLTNRDLALFDGKRKIWELPKGVKAQDFLLADINHDGEENLLVLCWKRGRYGDSRPFWVKRDDPTWSQHIYIYEFVEKGLGKKKEGQASQGGRPNQASSIRVKPIWMASYIGKDVTHWDFNPKDRLVLYHPDGSVDSWDWLSWGLTYLQDLKKAGEK